MSNSPTPGFGETFIDQLGGSSAAMKKLGLPLAGAAITGGLEASDFYGEPVQRAEAEKYDPYGRLDLGLGNLVNMTDGGEGTINKSQEFKNKISQVHLGKKCSNETKLKMKTSATGRIKSELTKNKIRLKMTNNKNAARAVIQYNLDGFVIKEWASITEAANFYKIPSAIIHRSALLGKHLAAGCVWKFKKEDK
jgi:hypothetical protein